MRPKYYRRSEDLSELLTEFGLDSMYAPIAKGTTNGDNHDHNGGDGADINHIDGSLVIGGAPDTVAAQKLQIGNNTEACVGMRISPIDVNWDIVPNANGDLIIANGNGPYQTFVRSGGMSINGGVHVGGLSDPGDDNLYVDGNCSALTFTDRTPAFLGDAIADLKKIKTKDGKVDHSTLPELARVVIRKTENVYVRDEENEIIVSDGKAKIKKIEQLEPGRDLGGMISVLVVGMQQLIDLVEKQGEMIAVLEKQNTKT
jgi:hypothetical protein